MTVGDGLALDVVLERLNGQKLRKVAADRWQSLCPAHGDRNPSLSIRSVSGRVLRIVDDLVRCFQLSMGDLFDSESERCIGMTMAEQLFAGTPQRKETFTKRIR
jgi:hypothetical protein